MREIKFRGLTRRKNSKWSGWHYGDLWHEKSGICVGSYEVDPETVGQFTGLLDADGREIYEGDIVKVDGWRKPSLVEWFDANAQFVVDKSLNLGLRNSFMRVIGNIHDNLDLLERGEN